MEFLRFGSSVPGEYWGCCACCIIQNFKQHPDTPASIQLVSGDGGGALTKGPGLAFAGPTLRDIFNTRIRIGTFGLNEMPNHTFFAILEGSQLSQFDGAWLKILKENGFEFIRTVDNSVYTGSEIADGGSPHPNYIFGLFRNIGRGKIKDPFTPPKAWTDLPDPKSDLEIWEAGETKILSEADIVAAGAPVIMAGLRTEFPPQLKEVREKRLRERIDKGCPNKPSPGVQNLYASVVPSKESGEACPQLNFNDNVVTQF